MKRKKRKIERKEGSKAAWKEGRKERRKEGDKYHEFG